MVPVKTISWSTITLVGHWASYGSPCKPIDLCKFIGTVSFNLFFESVSNLSLVINLCLQVMSSISFNRHKKRTDFFKSVLFLLAN
jgi:hypothetical protein